MAVAYADIGKKAKGLLNGDSATGQWQLSPKLTVTGKTTSGLELTLTAVTKGDKIEPSLKAVHSKGRYTAEAVADAAGKVTVTTNWAEVAPGLKLGGSLVVPDPTTAKVTAEYVRGLLSAKATVGLSASPVVDLAVGRALNNNVLVGVEAGYDTGKSTWTKYNLAAGYHAPDFQALAQVTDRLQTAKLTYLHVVSPTTMVGAEVSRKLVATPAADTSFALAAVRSLPNGATAKLKLDSTGTLSALYKARLHGGEVLTGAVQVQATKLSASPVKYGFALDLS